MVGMSNGTQRAAASSDLNSTPFLVSAPGKVIVFGEHAVVYGRSQPAMAASISLRSYLHISPSPSADSITLNFLDIGLSHTWPVSSLPWTTAQKARTAQASSNTNGTSTTSPSSLPTTLDQSLVSALEPHLAHISPTLPEAKRRIHKAAASTFLYLYALLSDASAAGHVFTLRSTIPIGAGLGSSASISVCLATALLLLSSGREGLDLPSPTTDTDLAGAALESINAHAFLGESLIHGTPSGVDNTVSTLGRAVLFRRGTEGSGSTITSNGSAGGHSTTVKPTRPRIDPLHRFPQLPLLLVDTKQDKSTAAEVGKVRVLKERHERIVGRLLDVIEDVVLEAVALVESMPATTEANNNTSASGTATTTANAAAAAADTATAPSTATANGSHAPTRADTVARLGELVALNHGCLSGLGVSHARLEELGAAVRRSGVGWFKLTGAGGGGCGFVLLREGVEKAELKGLEDEVDALGMRRFEVVLGGRGSGVCAAGVGGLDEFVGADSREQLMRLVEGVQWRYWST